jgi:peptidoglycan/xylan/chitin deacetylase (PgdA/CDA1 family)
MKASPFPGALVISLDFELHWGMRDRMAADASSTSSLVRSRELVPRLASAFARRGVRATWATVGFLFASTGDELSGASPAVRPRYADPTLDPYLEAVGNDEDDDPLHLAGSLVDAVAAEPGQEIGSHTFSHYYCLEEGQDEAAFEADLVAAQDLARRHGRELRSLVLPRNQWNPAYTGAVVRAGFSSIRGPQPTWAHRARSGDETTVATRGLRLVDTYAGLSAPPTTSWDDVVTGVERDGLADVPASAFLRPYSPSRRSLEPLRLRRLTAGIRDAARRSRIFHLWWHPHNFADHPDESFELLDRVLDEAERLGRSDGLRMLSMGDVATMAGAPPAA